MPPSIGGKAQPLNHLGSILRELGIAPITHGAARRYMFEVVVQTPDWLRTPWRVAAMVRDTTGAWQIEGFPQHEVPSHLSEQLNRVADRADAAGLKVHFWAHVLETDPLVSATVEGEDGRIFFQSFSTIEHLAHILGEPDTVEPAPFSTSAKPWWHTFGRWSGLIH